MQLRTGLEPTVNEWLGGAPCSSLRSITAQLCSPSGIKAGPGRCEIYFYAKGNTIVAFPLFKLHAHVSPSDLAEFLERWQHAAAEPRILL